MAPRTPAHPKTRARVALILDAAVILASGRGWKAVTPSAIARRTGVSRSWISVYCGGRIEILEAVGRRETERIVAGVAASDGHKAKWKRIEAVIRAFLGNRGGAECRAMAELGLELGTLDGYTLYTLSDALSGTVGKHAPALAAAWLGVIRHVAQSPRQWSPTELHGTLYRVALGFLDRE